MKKTLLFFILLAMLFCSPTAGGQQIKADVRYLPMMETMKSEAGVTSSFANGVAVGIGGCYYYGNRIGFGKAYYDHFLDRQTLLHKIGICYEEQLVERIEPNPWDVKMDEMIYG